MVVYTMIVMSRPTQTTRPTPTAPHTIARECIANRVRLMNRAVTGIYDQALRPHGLRVSQMGILVAVACRGPVKPGDVGRDLCLEKSTLSRNVDRMVQNGWLDILPGDDGRSQRIRITAKGNRLLAKVTPAWRQAQRRTRSLLGKQGTAAVHTIARTLPGGVSTR